MCCRNKKLINYETKYQRSSQGNRQRSRWQGEGSGWKSHEDWDMEARGNTEKMAGKVRRKAGEVGKSVRSLISRPARVATPNRLPNGAREKKLKAACGATIQARDMLLAEKSEGRVAPVFVFHATV